MGHQQGLNFEFSHPCSIFDCLIEKQVVLYSCLTPEGTINLRLAGELRGRDRSVPCLVLGEWKEDMGEGNGEDQKRAGALHQGTGRRRRRRRKTWWVSAIKSVGFGKWEFGAGVFVPFFFNLLAPLGR